MRHIKQKKVSENFQKLIQPSNLNNKRSSINMESHIGEYHYISVDKLRPYSKQARKIFNEDDLINLSNTIAEFGIRQPLTILKTAEQGVYEVLSGERRLKAAQMAGLIKVPCIILHDEKDSQEIALVENMQRIDLHPLEFSEACVALMEEKGFDQSQLAIKLGINKSKISEALLFNKIPKKIKQYLVTHNIYSRDTLRKLTKFSNENEMESLLGIISKNSSSKKQLIRLFISENKIFSNFSIKNIPKELRGNIVSELQNIIDELNNLSI